MSLADVADQIKAELAIRCFPIRIDLADRRKDAVLNQLEMIHQVFDVGIHTFLGGQADPAIMNLSWTLRQDFERLLDDTETLADFLNPQVLTNVPINGLA